MPDAQCSYYLSSGGVAISRVMPGLTGDHPNSYEVTLPVAKTAIGWLKVDADEATCTLAPGHGYVTGNFDVYWSGGVNYGHPCTIAGDALTFTAGGVGTEFPANGTAVVICKPVTINTAIDGDAIKILGICLEYADSTNVTSLGKIDMWKATPATLLNMDLVANVPRFFDILHGATNIFTGDPIVISYASHNNVTYAATLKIVSLEDSTP